MADPWAMFTCEGVMSKASARAGAEPRQQGSVDVFLVKQGLDDRIGQGQLAHQNPQQLDQQ